MAKVNQATVKSVLSGDTVVLSNVNNPSMERTFSLAFVSAPRLKREGDESFAVESRDFIRRQLVGKVVQFHVLYSLPTGTKRDYGTITLQSGHQLPDISVAEGYLKVREDAGKREEAEEATELIERVKMLESRAKADQKGMWAPDADKISTAYELADAQAFLEKHRGKPLDAVVEKVLSGDRLIVRLAESPTKHVQTMFLLAGVRAPNTKRANPSSGQEQPAEPFGEEAQRFVETRLLQRGVVAHVLGVSPQNQLIGSLKHPNGDIAVFELQAGLARCNDHHATMLGSQMSALRQAENTAKGKRLGVFHGHTAQKTTGSATEVVVSRVQTADTLFLRYPNGTEKRVSLSSVRQPKPSDPKQAPFGDEAKEFLRKRLIGKHVKVTLDAKRAATEGFAEREMATVTQSSKNVALELVQAGYASVIRHRMDDPDRSPIYDELLIAEDEAQKAAKGMWAPKPPEARQYVDYSESLEKAKRLATLLSRQKRVPGIVDFVKGGSRFTVLIPRENAKLTFVLSGIRAPKSARNANEKSEPFGQEAHDLATKRCQQRDVEIDVEDTDKFGGFIGKLFVNRENFARVLLEEGYASVHAYSAEKAGNAAELFAAERKAKDARKGIWQDYDPSQDEDASAGASGDLSSAHDDNTTGTNGTASASATANGQAAPARKDYRDVVATFIDATNCHIKLQQIGASSTGALDTLMNSFRSLHLGSGSSTSLALPGPPKAGDLVAARFTEDDTWYRARVRRNDRENKSSEVIYIDYGNAEVIPWSRLRSCAQPQFSTTALKPQALDAALSFVQFSGAPQYLTEARNWLEQRLLSSGAQMVANVDAVDERDGTLHVTLWDAAVAAESRGGPPAFKDSVNAEAVREGLGMAARKLARWERASGGPAIAALKVVEQQAKDDRLGMWEYGDLTED